MIRSFFLLGFEIGNFAILCGRGQVPGLPDVRRRRVPAGGLNVAENFFTSGALFLWF